jgi:hexosaminidase
MYSVYASFALDQLSNMAQIFLNTETVGYDIYYTLDGNEPTIQSNKYTGSFVAPNKSVLRAGLFNSAGKLMGRITEVRIK